MSIAFHGGRFAFDRVSLSPRSKMPLFEKFLRDCAAKIKRIVSASKGDASAGDVTNEAWTIVEDRKLEGTPIDLASAEGRDFLLKRLYGKFVLSQRTRVGLALRLDKDWDKDPEDAGPAMAERLSAPEDADPLVTLQQQETASPLDALRARSYSQATAYAICLQRWSSPKSLAGYLCIRCETLNGRIEYWSGWIKHQPSLFDGVERIGLDFHPYRGNMLAPRTPVHAEGTQWAWPF